MTADQKGREIDVALKVLKRRFTVEEYERMGQAGILSEDDRVELIEGEIIEMLPIGPPHSAVTSRLAALFADAARHRATFRAAAPVRLGTHSMPQPDLVLAKPRDDYYASRHPGPEDALLVVEVADTSLDFDRQMKVPLYARAGIQEVWLVALPAGEVEVYRRPSAHGYASVSRARPGDDLSIEGPPRYQHPCRAISRSVA